MHYPGTLFRSRRQSRVQAGLLTALILGLAHPAQAGKNPSPDSSAGDVVVSLGGEWPQGSTTAFYDPGFNIAARGAYHLPFLEGVIPTFGLGATFFPGESGLVEDFTDSFVVLAKEESDRYSIALNIGIQVGSPTRRGFFRPRAGIAPGFYMLSKYVERTLSGDDAPSTRSPSGWAVRVGRVSSVPTSSSLMKSESRSSTSTIKSGISTISRVAGIRASQWGSPSRSTRWKKRKRSGGSPPISGGDEP
jgi:hypothetical protein